MRLEPLVQLVDVDAALPGRLPQHLGDLLALLVGDALLGGLHQPSRGSRRMESGYSARDTRQLCLFARREAS